MGALFPVVVPEVGLCQLLSNILAKVLYPGPRKSGTRGVTCAGACVCVPLSSLQFIDHSLKEYLSNIAHEPGSVLGTWATKGENHKQNSPPTWWRPAVKHTQNNQNLLDFNATGNIKHGQAMQRDEAE